MSKNVLLAISFLLAISLFIFFMCFILYKEYRVNKIQNDLKRQLADKSRKEKFSILKFFNINIEKIERKFLKAGINADVENIIFSYLLIATLILIIGIIINNTILSLIVPIVLGAIGYAYIEHKGTNRVIEINKQFINALIDIGDYLRIDSNLSNAIKNVTPNVAYPLKGEFIYIIKEIDSNTNILDALKHFDYRVNSTVVNTWVDSMLFANDKRANVSDLCIKHSAKVRKRLTQNEKLNAKLSGLKFISIMIMIILLGMAFMMFGSSPEFKDFLHEPFGRVLALITGISYTVTTVFIFRKINKEVTIL
ncbi:secretion system protein F [Clostridium botulinum]|uniref:type II secretion system F family protein n=1 Tax=Clostridium botulinum TaxID=1491 RepID=UPI0004708A0A|nr:secretion system protein F [Clostridium botulinum]OSA73660.1 secretion system protein F [Clostridium botulinum]